MSDDYTNNWISYGWRSNSNLDYLIYEKDLELANQLGGFEICYCAEYIDAWLTIFYKEYIIKVSAKTTGISRLPSPKYIWDDWVFYKDKIYQIDTLAWHYKGEYYYYFLKGKKRKVSKRILDSDINRVYTIEN